MSGLLCDIDYCGLPVKLCYGSNNLKRCRAYAAPAGWQGPAAPPPMPSCEKIICALSTLPVHCRSVNFM